MALAKAPVDVIGTGSFLPERWSETYATADVIAYQGEARVKIGREFLLRGGERWPATRFSSSSIRSIPRRAGSANRSEEHTSELQSLMRISYAVFCLTKKNNHN